MGNTAGPMPPMLPAQIGGNTFPARLAPLAGSQSVPLALPAGARVVAEVVQAQTDGQVLLRLGQTLLAATLPGQRQVGEQLPLIVLSEPGAQPALLLAPQSAAPATQSELSSTAQLLARLQQQPSQGVRAAEPLWPQPDGTASPQLAQALAGSVRSSGLFYESHLAAWVQGELPTQALLQEPQGRLSALTQQPAPPAASSAAPAGAATPPTSAPSTSAQNAAAAAQAAAPAASSPVAAGTPAALASHADAVQAQLQAQVQTQLQAQASAQAPPRHAVAGLYASMQAQGGAALAAAQGAQPQALPAQLQALVQQQLATLTHGAVVWTGQAWPGQDLEWRIEPDEQQQDGGAAPRTWTSVLRLQLAHLGELVVTLQLSPPQHLRVRVEHAPQARAALHANGSGFRQALQDAGLSLEELALRPLPAGSDG